MIDADLDTTRSAFGLATLSPFDKDGRVATVTDRDERMRVVRAPPNT